MLFKLFLRKGTDRVLTNLTIKRILEVNWNLSTTRASFSTNESSVGVIIELGETPWKLETVPDVLDKI